MTGPGHVQQSACTELRLEPFNNSPTVPEDAPGLKVIIWLRTSSIIDLNSGSHTGRKDDARRHLVNMDTDRDALGKAHPGEDGVDRGYPLTVGLRVRYVDGAREAVDMAAYHLTVTHELDLGGVAYADRSEVRFLEICVDPK